MATEAQIIANRNNAQKSTGPLTPEGKAAVSQNALKHGLSARKTVISSENQADFDLYQQHLFEELAPIGPVESMLAERIVSLSWRLYRAEHIHNLSFNTLNLNYLEFHLKELEKLQAQTSSPVPELALGQVAVRDFSSSRALDRLQMYERRIEQSLFKTLLEFQRLRLLRNSNSHTQDIDFHSPVTNNHSPVPEPPTMNNEL